MPARAFIIAIEEYQSECGLSPLKGTLDDAKAFAKFAHEQLRIPKENIVFCSSGKSCFRTHGATLLDVRDAVECLLKNSQDGTDLLLAYLSGHGMMIPGQGAKPHTDVLLLEDFKHVRREDGCLPIEDLTRCLSRSLGAGMHLWFVDACRTVDRQLISASLGLNPERSTSGTAGWYQLTSTTAGTYAPNDRVFVQSLKSCLEGDCDLQQDPERAGRFWITWASVARGMVQKLSALSRGVETRSLSERADFRIRSVDKAAPTATILGPDSIKIPPVELLRDYDEVIFLGETNGQLPKFIEKALPLRNGNRWKKIEVFSIEDLSQAGRPGEELKDLESERQQAEDFLRANGARLAEQLILYRYSYAGTYASLWTAADGRRRAHASARILGVNIRKTPGSDFVDFPQDRNPTVDQYFRLADGVRQRPDCRRIFPVNA